MGNADVSRGEAVEDVLLALDAAGRGRFRGVRRSTTQDDHPPLNRGAGSSMDDPKCLAGARKVGSLGFTYDAMGYHPQLPELAEVARQCPETPIVINHLGCILGTGPYRDRRSEIPEFWYTAMAELASRGPAPGPRLTDRRTPGSRMGSRRARRRHIGPTSTLLAVDVDFGRHQRDSEKHHWRTGTGVTPRAIGRSGPTVRHLIPGEVSSFGNVRGASPTDGVVSQRKVSSCSNTTVLSRVETMM